MAKTWKGYAAATLTATLMMGMIGPSYAGTLTLAGFGADQQIVADPADRSQIDIQALKRGLHFQRPNRGARFRCFVQGDIRQI